MLVFSRQRDESFMIGDDIKVTIVEFRGGGNKTKVRIGVSAPKDIPVHRMEVYNAIKRKVEEEQAKS